MRFAAGVFRFLVAHCGFSALLWITQPVRGPPSESPTLTGRPANPLVQSAKKY